MIYRSSSHRKNGLGHLIFYSYAAAVGFFKSKADVFPGKIPLKMCLLDKIKIIGIINQKKRKFHRMDENKNNNRKKIIFYR